MIKTLVFVITLIVLCVILSLAISEISLYPPEFIAAISLIFCGIIICCIIIGVRTTFIFGEHTEEEE